MNVLNRFSTDKEDVRHMPDSELAELGICLIDRKDVVLQCTNCKETWTPQLDANGKLPFDYWVCPAGCNR
jgi:hypothetical protein